MKKKVVFNWPIFLISFILMLSLVFMLIIGMNDVSSTGQIIGIIMMIIGFIVYILVMNALFVCSTLTEDSITFQHQFTGKKQTFPVGRVNKFVVDVDSVDHPRLVYVVIYANKKGGQILGAGNNALMALMKCYPHIPVVIKFFEGPITISRRTAKYIVKHQRTSKFKCKQLCEYYHLPKKLLEQDDN